MSDTGTQVTTQTAAGQQAATAPPAELLGAQTQTNYMYVPSQNMPQRTVKGEAAKQGLKTGSIDPAKDVIYVSTRANPAGEAVTASMAKRFSANQIVSNTVSATVKSDKLIDAKGNFRDQYTRNDAASELYKLKLEQRQALLKDLYSRGMFPTKQGPSATGLDDNSISAMEQFLWTVNGTGYTWDVAKPIVMNQYPNVFGAPPSGYGAPSYTVSNPDDIERVANSVAEQIIGKRLSSASLNKIIQTVQGRERAAGLQQGGETVSAPSPQTVAQQEIEQSYAGDAQSMRMGQAAQFLDQLMGSI